MAAQSAELIAKIAIWRAKAADNTITLEEMKEAVIAMRAGRMEAAAANASSSKKSSKPKAKVEDADDMLNELGD